MKHTLPALFLLLGNALCAQPLTQPLCALPARLSALSPSFRNALSFTTNPAALAGDGKIMFAAAGERRFGIGELGSHALAARIPLQGNALGLQLGQGAGAGWKALAFTAGYGRQLGDNAAVGLAFTGARTGGGGVVQSSLGYCAGALFRLRPQVLLGFSVAAPAAGAPQKEGGMRSERRYALGLGWEAPGQWMLSLELYQSGSQRPALGAACLWQPGKGILAGAGIDTGIGSIYLTAGLPLAGMTVQPTVVLHRELGATPGLLLTYPAK